MKTRPLTFADPGRFELYCHHSPPTTYPEESHETVQICVPMPRALYSVIRQSETGRSLVQHLGARDVLVLPVGQPHGVAWRRSADIVSLQLSRHFIAEALGVAELRLEDTFALRDPFITAAADQLRTSLRGGEPISPAFAEAIATVIAHRVGLRAGTAAPGERKNVQALSGPHLARIEYFIEQHLDQPISLTTLAQQSSLSLWHFTRRFHASHGVTPHAFITERRLARAQTLLTGSRLSITEIALEVGMSHSHFSRSFLQRFGVSPREFRRQTQS
jgi:AraC-like DNA-binding protein